MKKLLLALTLVLCLAVTMVAFTSCGGNGDDGCEHKWADAATTDKLATCTKEGSASIKCELCGEKKADSVTAIPAYGHAYNDGVTVDATCTVDGSLTKTCATCGDINVTPIPSSGEHTWADSATVDVEATCYVDGYKSVKCTACNEIKADSTEIIPAGHYWGLATTDVPATCTTDGVKTVKCVSCGIQQIGSEEIIPAFGHSDIATVIVPTIFSEGRIKGTCSTCGTYVNEAVGKTEVTLNAYTTTEKTPYSETANIGDALGNKTFAPGNDLYLEFSVLLNSTTDNINGEGFGYGHIAKKADPNASGAIYKEFSWFYYKPSAKWCNFKGGFEFSSTKEFTYGPTWKEYGTAEDIVILDNYDGWHRFGVQYTQNVYENNGEFTYDVTVTVYVDGVKVSQSIMDWGAMFYSAEVVDGATVYTQNPDVADYYVVCYNIASGHLIADNDPTAYFPFGDISLTVGSDFAMKVNKLDTPVEGTYVIDEETTLPANQHFEYVRPASENLYDETLDSYDYPVDEIKPADATVDYSVTSGGTKYHKYVADSNKRVAFINIKDTVFNTVTLEVAEGSKVVYSFFSKMPSKVGEVVSYAIEYRTFITATEDVTVAIPANAAYLVLYYQDNANTKYVPEKVTFSFDENALSEQLKNPCVDEFEYPIEQIKPSQGTIASKDGKYIPNFDWVTGYLSIKDCAFDQVIIEVNETTGYVGYGFLSQFPDIYDYAEFSEGWTATTYITAESAEYAGPGTKFTVDIPDDAVCLVLYWHDWDDSAAAPVMFKPASVTFTNSDAHPGMQSTTVVAPTLFSDGLSKVTCPVCGMDEEMVVPAGQAADLHPITSTTNVTEWIYESANIGDVLGDKNLYGEDGVDIYVEFSILLNETMDMLAQTNFTLPGIYENQKLTGKNGDGFYFLYIAKDWMAKGGFEIWNSRCERLENGYLYGPDCDSENLYVGNFDGWHRIGVQMHFEAFVEDSKPYYVNTVTLYIDGVKVHSYMMRTDDDLGGSKSILSAITATVNDDGEIVGYDNIDSRWVCVYRYTPKLKSEFEGETAYFPIADCYVSAGDGFVMNVIPVTNPEAKDFTQDGVTLSGKMYFELVEDNTDNGDSDDSENAGTTTPVNPGFGTDSEESENAGTTTPPIFSTPDSEESENAGTTTPPIFSTPDSEDAA